MRTFSKKTLLLLLAAGCLLLAAGLSAWGGQLTANGYAYKPAQGARGQAEYDSFSQGLDRIDAHLAGSEQTANKGAANGYAALDATGKLASSQGVSSFNGRTGVVTSQPGDYTTSIVAEGVNLYYTNGRVSAVLSTWPGSADITTLGTVATGTWNATPIAWTLVNKTGAAPADIGAAPATTGTAMLKGNGAGGTTAAVANTDFAAVRDNGDATYIWNGNKLLSRISDIWAGITGNLIVWGSNIYGTDLATVISTIGSSTPANLIVPPGTFTVSANVSVYTNIRLLPQNGANISLADTKTLTINGPFEAGLYRVFSYTGTGKAVFGYPVGLYPEWWGTVGDGTTDDRAPIQAALDCLTNGAGGSLIFSGKTYAVNSFHPTLPLLVNCETGNAGSVGYDHVMLAVGSNSGSYQTIKIIGRDGATLTSSLLTGTEADLSVMLALMYKLQDVQIEGMTFVQTHGVTSKETGAIETVAASDFQVQFPHIINCRFKNFSRGVYLPGCDAPLVEKCIFTSDLGRDSGSSTNAQPNVGIRLLYTPGWTSWGGNFTEKATRDVEILNNHFDGCVAGDVSGNAGQKTSMDGLYWGAAQGVVLENNTIYHFSYEGIFVLPASDGTNNYSAIIKGNHIDSGPVIGEVAVPGFGELRFGIRCDESNSIVIANTINHGNLAILVVRETNYASDIYRVKIISNMITMRNNPNTTNYINYGIFLNPADGASINIHDCEITDNSIFWPDGYTPNLAGMFGICVTGSNNRVTGNYVKASAKSGSYPWFNGNLMGLAGIWLDYSAQNIYLNNNETVNCNSGIILNGTSGHVLGPVNLDKHIFTGCYQNITIFYPAYNTLNYVSASLIAPGYQRCQAYCSTAQAIAPGPNVKVAIDTNSTDTINHGTPELLDSTNHRITPTIPGWYRVNYQVTFSDISGVLPQIQVLLYKNGSLYYQGVNEILAAKKYAYNDSCYVYLNGTDYLELYVNDYISGGSTQYLYNHGEIYNFLSVVGPQ